MQLHRDLRRVLTKSKQSGGLDTATSCGQNAVSCFLELTTRIIQLLLRKLFWPHHQSRLVIVPAWRRLFLSSINETGPFVLSAHTSIPETAQSALFVYTYLLHPSLISSEIMAENIENNAWYVIIKVASRTAVDLKNGDST